MDSIQQTLLPLRPSSISIYRYSRRLAGHAARALINASIATDGETESRLGVFGISISQADDGTIAFIALATDNAVHLIDAGGDSQGIGSLDSSLKNFLGSTTTILAGFAMHRIALRLRHHLGHHIRGVDLSTLFSSSSSSAWLPSKVVQIVCAVEDTFNVDRLWHENNQDGSIENLCLRAWISAKWASCILSSPVCLTQLPLQVLLHLGILLRQTDILARAVPRVTKNEHESYNFKKDGKMRLQNARYNTRVRISKQSYVEVVSHSGKIYQGKAVRTEGKTTEIYFRKGVSDNVLSVRVVGLAEPTPAEKARDALLLRVLQGEDRLLDADFVRFLWFRTPADEFILLPSPDSSSRQNSLRPYFEHLNESQVKIVAQMTSQDPIVIVHGPPGTGKTTTISSAAKIWSKMYCLPVWIIGHSNVSVKNIAENLLKQDVDFKLIVSKEFYVGWHEHIYEKITAKLIRMDQLPDNIVGMSCLIGSSTVILSTLGLLSNPAVERYGLFDIVPFERLVVDEASQINVFEYMHIFHKFRKSLLKVCFFGDPKQLPPFGQEKAKNLQSIFDLEHLKLTSYFLNVQYRMPIPLGDFISKQVYEARLRSSHLITVNTCVRFVDTLRGIEEKSGSSWTVS
ncbi:P-loop containing nucleoside triphosphate hydrolase protein [Lentinula aciculospora]|uniref:P-loop containing nucleoside triphosphate hydrolase protein n=1 Tax=Lentinula aciculospora TaxID=153920 RepID=A0A9W9AAL1_9AGAR|nr:P-loop containing nucleoside triphosphate hydrolase protein [Lentinula aciculospora]